MDDESVIIAEQAGESVSVCTVPGAFWIEYLPFLRYIPSWVPGTHSMKAIEHFAPYVALSKNKAFDEVKSAMVRPIASLMTSLLVLIVNI